MRSKPMALISLLLLISLQLFSYNYERVETTQADGYKIIHIKEASVPWDIFVLEFDMANNAFKLKTGLANDQVAWIDGGTGVSIQKETLAAMIARRTAAGENVIGGINADFFNMTNGMQFNITATDGQIASTGITSLPHSAVYTDETGEPFINLIKLTHSLTIPGSGTRYFNGVNEVRYADNLILFNHFIGQPTSFANIWGLELLLEPQEEVSYINGTQNYKVIKKAVNVTRTSDKQVIASGHGTAYTYLSNADVGDIVQIKSTFTGLGTSKITEMVGGWGHIVTAGANTAASSIAVEGSMSHENDRHPRSAMGYNQDKSKLYLIAIDGRTTLSAGMNLSEMANFMIDELGIWEGLNFDGGGSTTLMAGSQTINNPSGTVQRAVANTLLVVKEVTTHIPEWTTQPAINVFPNPARDYVVIDLKEAQTETNMYFEIYSFNGQKVSSKTMDTGNNPQRIELPGLLPGAYLYRVVAGSKTVTAGKFMIQ